MTLSSYLRTTAVIAFVAVAALPRAAEATSFSYTFDASAEGWTAIASGTGQTLTFDAVGGNPGGFVEAAQTVVGGPGSGTLHPIVGIGRAQTFDASSYGGMLSFDTAVESLSTTIFDPHFSDVSLGGEKGGSPFALIATLFAPLSSTFTPLSVALDTSTSWTLVDFFHGVPHAPTQAEWLDYLPFVTTLNLHNGFSLDRPNVGTVSFGFDNVRFVEAAAPPAVPEPASLLLLGAGLIGAGARRYRRNQ